MRVQSAVRKITDPDMHACNTCWHVASEWVFLGKRGGDDESPPELYSIDAGSPVMEVLRMAQLHGRLQLAAHG